MYLSYDEYVEMGGTMDEADYPTAERRARALLDDWTLGRVKRLEEVPEEVELAMYEIISNLGQAYGGGVGGLSNVSSFSNGINTVSFDAESSSASAVRSQLYDLVASILPVELISAAVRYNVR